jgi:hypothetical protein
VVIILVLAGFVSALPFNPDNIPGWNITKHQRFATSANRYFFVFSENPNPDSPVKIVKSVFIVKTINGQDTLQFLDIRFFLYGRPHILVPGKTGMVDLYLRPEDINACGQCHKLPKEKQAKEGVLWQNLTRTGVPSADLICKFLLSGPVWPS